MQTIVVSGINLFTGGTLKVLHECVSALSSFAGDQFRIIALVHNEAQHPAYPNVQYISYPKSRSSYLYRLYYEYIGFKKLSKQLQPDAWFSMHDTTPNVIAKRRMVYCHNPFPFYKAGLRGLFLQRSIFLFSFFSKYLYQINIKKNDYVIVQQEWMRDAFKKLFSIDNLIVSIPVTKYLTKKPNNIKKRKKQDEKVTFFYPVTPMIHKNFEMICEAAALLEKEEGMNFEVLLTTNGAENTYARWIYKKYHSLKTVRYVGFLNRDEMDLNYQNSDCLLFPSKAETWGLPITEAKENNLPIIVSNLPYAKEAVGKYDRVKFFDPDNARQLADEMKHFMQGTIVYDETFEIEYKKPFARNWDELVHYLFA